MDTVRKGHVIEFNRPVPASLSDWYNAELKAYTENDKNLSLTTPQANPLVSAVIPATRETKFLAESVECLARQDYPNIEILVVNEGDLDEVDAAVRELRRKFPDREISLINKKQSGTAEAKNFGVRQARGTFVMVLEAEDLVTPDYVSKGINILRSNNSNLFFSGVEISGDERGEEIPAAFDPYFIRYNNTIPKSAIFSRSLWHQSGGFKPALPFCEDWDFWINCAKAGVRPAQSNEKLFIDRVFTAYDSSLQGNNAEKIQAAIIRIANQDIFSVEEVTEAQSTLVGCHSEWLWRCEHLEKSQPEDWLLRLLLALGHEGRGQVQDSMNDLGASIQFSSFKNWQPIYRLALILEKNNQRKEAAEFFHSVRSLRPDMAKIVNARLRPL